MIKCSMGNQSIIKNDTKKKNQPTCLTLLWAVMTGRNVRASRVVPLTPHHTQAW